MSDPELTQVEDRYQNRTYFEGAFSYVFGEQKNGMNKARQHGFVVIETVINHLFLRNDLLVHVDNEEDTDILFKFKYACINFYLRQTAEETIQRSKQKKFDDNEEAQAAAGGNRSPARSEERSSPHIKSEASDDGFSLASPFSISLSATPTHHTPCRK